MFIVFQQISRDILVVYRLIYGQQVFFANFRISQLFCICANSFPKFEDIEQKLETALNTQPQIIDEDTIDVAPIGGKCVTIETDGGGRKRSFLVWCEGPVCSSIRCILTAF